MRAMGVENLAMNKKLRLLATFSSVSSSMGETSFSSSSSLPSSPGLIARQTRMATRFDTAAAMKRVR
jgi:hypothetical protein